MNAPNSPIQPRRPAGGSIKDAQRRFVPVFTGWRKVANLVIIALWLLALANFWLWWLEPEHIHSTGRYVLVTIILLWVTLIPGYFIFLFAGARVPVLDELPEGARLAMVVTKAPPEPFPMVARTLEGMLNQRGAHHDTWLADEDPSPETLEWCAQHGVRVSSRKGVPEYHRNEWPRRTRCKEGNLAYFYDKFGYDNYDFVAQFDCDHRPEPDYLRNAIAPFVDPTVGYVSAPSICDANARKSWSARGRLYVEASLHGALQVGYNANWAPLCIGSHYTVRTAALRSVGGLGPELAEDHSTTLMLNAGGGRGVPAGAGSGPGDGPGTLTALAVHEFQWARSLITILFRYSPGYIPKLHAKRLFEFVFSQLWYPMFSSMLALSFLVPIAALLSREHFVNVTYIDFALHFAPIGLMLLAVAFWSRSTGMFRPADAPVISWEAIAFMFLRWPWALFGTIAAVIDRLRGGFVDFRITPKGSVRTNAIPTRIIAPYVLFSLSAGLTAWLIKDAGTAAGFYFFNIMNATVYACLVLLVLILHARENNRQLLPSGIRGLATGLALVAMTVVVVGASYQNGPKGLAAVNIGIKAFTLTETLYSPAGAGRGTPGVPTVRLRFQWHGFSRADQQQQPEPDRES